MVPPGQLGTAAVPDFLRVGPVALAPAFATTPSGQDEAEAGLDFAPERLEQLVQQPKMVRQQDHLVHSVDVGGQSPVVHGHDLVGRLESWPC